MIVVFVPMSLILINQYCWLTLNDCGWCFVYFFIKLNLCTCLWYGVGVGVGVMVCYCMSWV